MLLLILHSCKKMSTMFLRALADRVTGFSAFSPAHAYSNFSWKDKNDRSVPTSPYNQFWYLGFRPKGSDSSEKWRGAICQAEQRLADFKTPLIRQNHFSRRYHIRAIQPGTSFAFNAHVSIRMVRWELRVILRVIYIQQSANQRGGIECRVTWTP